MDNSWDIAYYFDRGLRPTGGKVTHIVKASRDLAAITGFAKDMPFTALIWIGTPDSRTSSEDEELDVLSKLEDAYFDDPPVEWEHPLWAT